MSHASIQTTVNVYGHWVPGSNRNAVNRVDDPVGPVLKIVSAAFAPQYKRTSGHPMSGGMCSVRPIRRTGTNSRNGWLHQAAPGHSG